MKKLKRFGIVLVSTLCVFSAALGLTACGGEDELIVSSGTSTTLVTSKAPDELSPENVVYAFLQKQSELQSYIITTEGKAVADLAGYQQDIHSAIYKNGEDFLNQAQSESVLVDMEHQSFSKNGKVVYRDDFNGEMSVATKEEYKKVYGFTADDVTLGGYIINNKTLRYATLEKEEGDTLTYYLRLAGDQSLEEGATTESATSAVRLQAKAYGSLDGTPAFSDVDVRLMLKKDWTPIGYTSECSYDCKKIFNMSIKQTLSSTYSKVNQSVEIPSVVQFNEQLGATPSEVAPVKGEESTIMKLAAAAGAAVDENDTLALPVSFVVNLFGAPLTMNGELSLTFKREALNSGNLLNALSLRFDVDLSAIPYISQTVNTLTVRYFGEGGLFLMLNRRADGQDHILYSYMVDPGEVLPYLGDLDLSLGNLQTLVSTIFDLEETQTGYSVSLKPAIVTLLNTGYTGLIDQLETLLGDTHGYIRSLLGASIDSLDLEMKGTEKLEEVAVTLEGTPAENTTMGEKVDLSVDVGLLNNSLFNGAFCGELQLRLNPSAIWTQNFFAIAQGKLHLDLTPAQPLLDTLEQLGGMAPLPAFVNTELNSLDAYYLGDGILTLVLNNEAGDPVFTTDVDLTQYLSATAPDGETGGLQDLQGLKLPQIIFEIKENGFAVSLGENLVTALDAAYQGLVKMAVDYITEAAGGGMMGGLAAQLIGSLLGAEITGAGIFVGRTDEGSLTLNLNVDGIPQMNGDSKVVSLLSITLTHGGELSADEKKTLLDAGETVKELHEMSEKAAEYDAQLQKFMDEMDVSEDGYTQYVANVTALQNKIASEKDGVKSLMANKSYLEKKTYGEQEYSVILLTAELYYKRATEFKTKFAEIQQDGSDDVEIDAKWDELNALYDENATVEGITVPAIGNNEVLKAAVGETTIASYLEKRDAHEDALAKTLISQIEKSKTTYQDTTDRNDLIKALTEIVTNFKPVYDKLPAAKQANVTEYSEYVKDIYLRNIDGVTKEYQAIETALNALKNAQAEEVTIDEILDTMKQLSLTYAWGYGYDYWETNTIQKVQPWGTTWITSLKPADLTKEEQTKVSDLNTLNRSLMKGTTATETFGKYTDLIIEEVRNLYEKIKDCRIVTEEGEQWNFEGLKEDKNELLEKTHGIRFLICKVLPTSINDEIGKDDPDLSQFARIDLTKYEKALAEHLQSTSGD